MKKTIALFALLGFIACQPADPADQTIVVEVNKEALSKTQASLCINDEELIEVDYGSLEKAYHAISGYKAIGFLNGTTGCALKKDFKKDGLAYEWFSLTLHDNCLENGTIWIAKSISRQDNSVVAEFSEFGGSRDKSIRLHAGYDVKIKDLSTSLGMKFYKCQ
jgi:hypothetical protein